MQYHTESKPQGWRAVAVFNDGRNDCRYPAAIRQLGIEQWIVFIEPLAKVIPLGIFDPFEEAKKPW